MSRDITIFKSKTDTTVGYNRSVQYALDRIKQGKSKDIINRIRTGEVDLKPELPGACFNGTFKYRADSGIIKHSGLCILDFDDLPEDDLKTWRDTLEQNEFIFACWTSPSGNGIKALVKIPREIENHKLYYSAIVDYFECPYLDTSGSDISRFCFESYDPDLYLNENSNEWTTRGVEEAEDLGTDAPIIRLESESLIIDRLMKWWDDKFGFNHGDRNNNLFKLAVSFKDFGIPQTVTEQIFRKFEEKDFQIKEINAIIRSAYKNMSTFGSKFFEDNEKRTQIEKAIRSGRKEDSIIKEFKEVDESVLNSIKGELLVKDFWYYSKNGAVQLSPHQYKYWLQQNKFFKYYPTQNGAFTFIQKDQNILDETNEKLIKDFVLKELSNRTDIGMKPFDFMAKSTKYFSADFLSYLDTANVDMKEDTKTECYIYFKNCVAKVTKDNIEQIDYIDINGFVWRRQIIDRDFNKCDHHESIFRTFLWKISGEDVPRYNSLKSVIGYLLHSYKTSANNRAVIFNDETISDNPNGGSGKGLFWNALAQMKRVASIDGKTFDFGKSFPYQTVSTDTQILVFDDVKKNFNFESLFSLITEGITLEYKGQDAIKLPVQQSPKILITTNYTVGGDGGSFDRRKFEVEFSGYFNAKHTPLDEFGHLLFDEWDQNEWDRFDSFMLNCVQFYLEKGLVEADFKNLPVRKLIKKTCQEFYEWAIEGNIEFNTRLTKSKLYSGFVTEYPDWDKKYKLSRKRFIIWVKSWADHFDYEVTDGVSNGDRWIQINNPDAPSTEEDDGLPF